MRFSLLADPLARLSTYSTISFNYTFHRSTCNGLYCPRENSRSSFYIFHLFFRWISLASRPTSDRAVNRRTIWSHDFRFAAANLSKDVFARTFAPMLFLFLIPISVLDNPISALSFLQTPFLLVRGNPRQHVDQWKHQSHMPRVHGKARHLPLSAGTSSLFSMSEPIVRRNRKIG